MAFYSHDDPPDKRPWRTLVVCVGSGILIFVSMLSIVLLLVSYAGAMDSSQLSFYWIMAGAGALFGFERWWSYEQGPVNPFHG